MKNRMMRIASVLLVAVLLSTCVISGTYAKYASEYTGESTARVAKWAFKFNNGETTAQNTFTFNLFEYTDPSVDVNGAEDNENVIAPGTQGELTLNIENDSEVKAKYNLKLSQTNDSGIPIEYSINGNDWNSDIATFTTSDEFTEIAIGANTNIITIKWRWVFENSTDVADTTLGEAGTATVTVTATVNVEQVD